MESPSQKSAVNAKIAHEAIKMNKLRGQKKIWWNFFHKIAEYIVVHLTIFLYSNFSTWALLAGLYYHRFEDSQHAKVIAIISIKKQTFAKMSTELLTRKISSYHKLGDFNIHALWWAGPITFHTCDSYVRTGTQFHTMFNNEKYQQFPYDTSGMTFANFAGELNIPVFLDNCIRFLLYQKVFMINMQFYPYVKNYHPPTTWLCIQVVVTYRFTF